MDVHPDGTRTMVLLGLTGGIGMGKSTAADFLERMGYPVADTDRIAREVVAPGSDALREIREAFGDGVFAADGVLDRSRLGQRVFADAGERVRLEGILHPRIRAEWERRTIIWRGQGAVLGAVVIPLLYETRAESHFDAIACVACLTETQNRRLLDRGWTADHIRQRIASQWPLREKIRRADFVVWTEPPPSIHGRQLRCVLDALGVRSSAGASSRMFRNGGTESGGWVSTL
ncbi:MAG: dephospho-CoA kinase [Verrucomicrobiae bacterium]|nr:dephospho-CoA kinase [Verrucomicrobiae bacterium]